MPDRQWHADDNRLPNLRNLLALNNNAGDSYISLVDEVKQILVEKLKANLLRYSAAAPLMVG